MQDELREEIVEKDKAIQKLFIDQQAYEDSLELANKQIKAKETEILFMREAVQNSSAQQEKLQAQIEKLEELNE